MTERSGYQSLIVWQQAMELAERVYTVSRAWPRDELYGLTSQVRRAAVSIPSNLVEGHGRSGRNEYAHHVSMAFGSLCELETQLELAERIGDLDTTNRTPLADLIASVR